MHIFIHRFLILDASHPLAGVTGFIPDEAAPATPQQMHIFIHKFLILDASHPLAGVTGFIRRRNCSCDPATNAYFYT
jgi:hypothetical protein